MSIETLEAELDAALQAQNAADSRYHKTNVALKESALAQAREQREDEIQAVRIELTSLVEAKTAKIDERIALLHAICDVAEELRIMGEREDALRHRAEKLDMPLTPKDSWEMRWMAGNTEVRRLHEKIQITTRGSW